MTGSLETCSFQGCGVLQSWETRAESDRRRTDTAEMSKLVELGASSLVASVTSDENVKGRMGVMACLVPPFWVSPISQLGPRAPRFPRREGR